LTAVFGPLDDKESRSRAVVQQFVALLKDKSLKPGDRLPTERELAATMGVSRASLREGLRALTMLGVVEQRQGSGTYLSKGLEGLPLEPYLMQLVMNRGRLADFMELRRIVEPEVAYLATERLDDAGRKILEKAWTRYEKAAVSADGKGKRGVTAEAEAGRRFHEALAKLTGNRALANLMESLGELIEATGESILRHPEVSSFEAHRALYEAVRAGRCEEARKFMQDHLSEVQHELLQPVEGA
jgi:GntR family transcriptional repressor for pyruvate dehydrogenase complex